MSLTTNKAKYTTSYKSRTDKKLAEIELDEQSLMLLKRVYADIRSYVIANELMPHLLDHVSASEISRWFNLSRQRVSKLKQKGGEKS